MSRDGSGTYSLPANTLAVSGDAISSTKFNSLVQDLEADANVDRPIAAGGTGASTASAARTNLGLAIGTDVQAFDAGLLSIAGLTTLADRSIYTTASDTYAVYTLTAAGRAILDDADAAAQRTTLGLGNGATTTFSAFALTLADDADAAASRTTLGLGTIATQNANNVAITGGSVAGITDLAVADGGTGASDAGTARTNLGLGTAATVNTGTSGATIPLLNAANTFGLAQTFPSGISAQSIELTDTTATFIDFKNDGAADFHARILVSGGTGTSGVSGTLQFFSAALTNNGSIIWHAGNDGAGSGLDADTLDGVQGSAYAALAGTQTFTGLKAFEAGAEATNGARITNSATSRRLHLYSGKVGSQNGDMVVDAEDGNNVLIQTSGATRATVGPTGFSARIMPSTETTSTLTVASANKTIQATGDITVPNAVFSAGDIILIYAGASARTITQGASVTMRLGGTATTGSRTLAARGVAVLFFVSSSEVVVSGGAVT